MRIVNVFHKSVRCLLDRAPICVPAACCMSCVFAEGRESAIILMRCTIRSASQISRVRFVRVEHLLCFPSFADYILVYLSPADAD